MLIIQIIARANNKIIKMSLGFVILYWFDNAVVIILSEKRVCMTTNSILFFNCKSMEIKL